METRQIVVLASAIWSTFHNLVTPKQSLGLHYLPPIVKEDSEAVRGIALVLGGEIDKMVQGIVPVATTEIFHYSFFCLRR